MLSDKCLCKVQTAHCTKAVCLLEYLNQNLTSWTTPTVISPFYNFMRYTVINQFLFQMGPIIFWLNFHLLFRALSHYSASLYFTSFFLLFSLLHVILFLFKLLFIYLNLRKWLIFLFQILLFNPISWEISAA